MGAPFRRVSVNMLCFFKGQKEEPKLGQNTGWGSGLLAWPGMGALNVVAPVPACATSCPRLS